MAFGTSHQAGKLNLAALSVPKRGSVIEGTSGVRKSRAADPTRGKGKSGGFRYMYYYIEQDGQIFLLMVFNKNEQDNLCLLYTSDAADE